MKPFAQDRIPHLKIVNPLVRRQWIPLRYCQLEYLKPVDIDVTPFAGPDAVFIRTREPVINAVFAMRVSPRNIRRLEGLGEKAVLHSPQSDGSWVTMDVDLRAVRPEIGSFDFPLPGHFSMRSRRRLSGLVMRILYEHRAPATVGWWNE